ncbi:hypothetical protein OKHIL_42570 [Mycolicibacterium mageritense]
MRAFERRRVSFSMSVTAARNGREMSQGRLDASDFIVDLLAFVQRATRCRRQAGEQPSDLNSRHQQLFASGVGAIVVEHDHPLCEVDPESRYSRIAGQSLGC